MVGSIQALELCQRVLLRDGTNEDARSLKSYLVAHGLDSKVVDLPDGVKASYGALVVEHGLRFLVDIDGNQV